MAGRAEGSWMSRVGIQQGNQGEVMCSSGAEGTDKSLLFWAMQRIQGEEPQATKHEWGLAIFCLLPSFWHLISITKYT